LPFFLGCFFAAFFGFFIVNLLPDTCGDPWSNAARATQLPCGHRPAASRILLQKDPARYGKPAK
jgi:hypothetical protein